MNLDKQCNRNLSFIWRERPRRVIAALALDPIIFPLVMCSPFVTHRHSRDSLSIASTHSAKQRDHQHKSSLQYHKVEHNFGAELHTSIYPKTIQVVLTFDDNDENVRLKRPFAKRFPAKVLLRFSRAARRQILDEGSLTFDIATKYRGLHASMIESYTCLFMYLEEMMWFDPRTATSNHKPPFILTQFDDGLIQALLFLEMLHEFDLDEPFRQDDWVRMWILHWVSNYDVLPLELACAWQLFNDSDVEIGLISVMMARVVGTWDKDTVYIMEDQVLAISESKVRDQELWRRVQRAIDRARGKGTFIDMWLEFTKPNNHRKESWFDNILEDPTRTDGQDLAAWHKVQRDRLQGGRWLHVDILHAVIGAPLPQLSLADENRRKL